jgi:hypothetical protein
MGHHTPKLKKYELLRISSQTIENYCKASMRCEAASMPVNCLQPTEPIEFHARDLTSARQASCIDSSHKLNHLKRKRQSLGLAAHGYDQRLHPSLLSAL